MKANIGMLFCLWISGVSAGYGFIGLGLGKAPESTLESFMAMMLSLGGWGFIYAYNRKNQ